MFAFWWGPSSWFISWYQLPVSSHGGKGRGSFWSLFYKALISFMMVPLLRLKHFPKVHLLILSHWALGFQHRNFNIGIQCIKHSDHSRYLGLEACSKLYSREDSVKLVCVAESWMFEDDKRPIPAEKSYTQLRNHWALWMSVCLGRKILQLFLLTSVNYAWYCKRTF